MARCIRLGFLSILLLATVAGAATAEVYVTSPSAGRILVLDSSGAVTRVIGTGGGIVEPYGIALDPARNLLVADYGAGRVLQFTPDGASGSILASNIPKPDGISVGPGGDVFLVSRDNRVLTSRLRTETGDIGTVTYLNQVWMVPAGGHLPVQVGALPESFRLAQTQTVTSGPYRGDLLVLSTRPGLVARMIQTGPTSFERSSDLVSYVPGEPTSMAFSRTGELLISTSDGRVLRYSDTGARLQPDFATGLPVGPTRMTINMDGVVHITPVGSTSIIRFDPYAWRLPDLTGATLPLAAALTTGCVPTPVGQNVTVSPAAGVSVIYDNVISGGQTCLQTTSLGAGVMTSPHNNTIPPYAMKLFEDPGFVVYDVTTTVRFTDTVAVDIFAQNPNSRLLVAHGTGGTFTDHTVLVTPDDPRAREGNLSEFIIYLDTRTNRDVVLQKLSDLQNAVNTLGSLIDEGLLGQIQSFVNQITTQVGNGGSDSDRSGAIQTLKGLKGFIRQNSGEGIPNLFGPDAPPNVAGILISSADTLIFQLTL